MKKAVIFIIPLLALVISSCSRPSRPALLVGGVPVNADILEQDTYNIPFWLGAGAKGRILVRFSAFDGMTPLKDDVLNSLTSMKDGRKYKVLLDAGRFNNPDALYSPDNTVFLAHRLGIVDEVYWVVPLFGSVTEADLEGFKGFLKQGMPEKASEIDEIRLYGAVAEGKINNIPVKIVSLKDLPEMRKPVIMEIESSYLASLYKYEQKTRILSFISGFYTLLRDKKVTADMVTLIPSNSNGRAPVKLRFLTLYLWALLNNPAMIEADPPVLWEEREAAWETEQRSPKEAVPAYKAILREYPTDAATHYDLSDIYFRVGDIEGCKKEMAETVKLDPGYSAGYVEYAKSLTEAGSKDISNAFLALAAPR